MPSTIEMTLSKYSHLFLPDPSFYLLPTIHVARELLGAYLFHSLEDVNTIVGGKIVETEAYLGNDDPASHASTKKITNRNILHFAQGGVSYIYFIYGMYHCMNVVAEPEGKAGCVLIRALEPFCGLEQMAILRKTDISNYKNFCNGPGKLCMAMNLSTQHNGQNLSNSSLFILVQKDKNFEIACGTRIGISKAIDLPLRFWIKGSQFVSR